MPAAATTQPPAATKKDATASGADAAACAAAATDPASLHCAELPPLPPYFFPTFLPSLLSPPSACTEQSRSLVFSTVEILLQSSPF